jgi:threonine dehydratase
MVTLIEIEKARERLAGVAARTPLIRYYAAPSDRPKRSAEPEIYLKTENLQPTGSFKLRGAYNKIASLTEAERKRGVVTHSSGNHAQGVAYAARAMGMRAVVVMPRNSSKMKQEAVAAMGAEVVLVGPSSRERRQKSEELAAQHGYVQVPPFNDEQVVAGQGTIGLEILEDLADVDLVLAPISGGGLVTGIAAAMKLSGSHAKVVGVEPELANDAQQSFRTGHIVEIAPERAGSTIADGLRGQSVGEITFDLMQKYVDDIVTVSEDDIRRAMRTLICQAHILAEPSGAVAFAACLLHGDKLPHARKIVAVVSGGNTEPQLLARIIYPEGEAKE